MKFDRALVVLMAVLLAERLLVAGVAYPIARDVNPSWDWSNNDGYDAIARNWVETGVYGLEPGVPTAARLPLYPALLAFALKFNGAHYLATALGLQVLLSLATGYFLYKLGYFLFGYRAAIMATILFILHPQVNNFVFRCATETTFIFLVTACLYYAVQFCALQRLPDAAGMALFWALAMLTRPSLELLPLVVLPPVLIRIFRRQGGARLLIVAAVLVLIGGAMVAPWLARNYSLSGRLPVLNTWTGRALYAGAIVSRNLDFVLSHEQSVTAIDEEANALLGRKIQAYLDADNRRALPSVRQEVEAGDYARDLAIEELRGMAPDWRRIGFRNLLLAPVLQMSWKSTWILILWNSPLLLLAWAGVLKGALINRKILFITWPIVGTFLYLWLAHALLWPQARYVLPALVPFTVFAAYFLIPLWLVFFGQRIRITTGR